MSDIFNSFNAKNGLRINRGHTITGITNQQLTDDEYSLTTEGQIYKELIKKIDISGATMSGGLYSPSLSGGTIFSGTTNIDELFVNKLNEDVTRVYAGNNIFIGGTSNDPMVNLIDSPVVNDFTATGNTYVESIYATTFFSGTTNIDELFVNKLNEDITRVYAGNNIFIGGTSNDPMVNLIDSPVVNDFTATGNTDLTNTSVNNLTVRENLFVQGTTFSSNTQDVLISANTITLNNGEINSGITKGFAGIVIDRGQSIDYEFVFQENNDTFRIGESGSTQAVATREDSPVANGFAYWNPLIDRFDTTTTISATTIYSGSTNLYDIFLEIANVTIVQPGLNMYTGGTVLNPTINISAATLNNLNVSGNTILGSVSATTFVSGTTNLSDVFIMNYDIIDSGIF